MQIKLKPIITALCTLFLAMPAYSAPASIESSVNSSTASDDKVVLNFENADIQTVIKAISKLSGKNFVIDPRVKGTINIVSEKPISKSESYKVLESALRMQGFATVEADGVIKVLPETDARTYGMRTIGDADSSKNNQGDQLITKVFNIDNGSATQLSNAIRPMVSPNNSIAVYPNTNSLVVTDYVSNMARITKIINEVNATNSTRIQPVTIKLKYAYASDVAQTLQSYLGSGNVGGTAGGAAGGSAADNGPGANITVDSLTNSIIITSNVQSKIDDLKRIAHALDTESSKSHNNLHVVYLKNADAAHVAEVLKTLASGQDNPDMTASPSQRTLSDTSSMFQGGSGGSGGGSYGGGGGSTAPKPSGGSSANNSTAGSDKNAPKVLIQAEPTTNSLIIQAPDAVYRNFRMIIDMLDVRRVQIMIEALIADVNTTERGSFGIQWVGGAGNNNLGVGVLSNYAGNGTAISSIAQTAIGLANPAAAGSPAGGGGIPNEVLIGLVTGTVNIGGQKIPGISTLANMITATSSGNILGRPTLLTLDNEEASIFVGQNIGLPSGSYATTGGNSTVNPFTTVNRQDIGTVLRLKPLVTQSGAIQLSVYQEDSKLDPNTLQPTGTFAQNGPNILKRNLKTQILVSDGQIIALGGMTSDNVVLQNSGIPLLSDIPYLGWLFSWQSRAHTKQNLVIFLRPVVIRNEEGAKALTNQRYRYVLEQQNMIKASGNALLPEIDAVTLDNQVPFNNAIPAQKAMIPNEPIVDLRNPPAMITPNAVDSSPNDNTVVKQTAPNAISIITND